MSLVELPVLPDCEPALIPGGVVSVTIFRTRDILSLPSCCGTQAAIGPIFLKSGKTGYRLPLNDETVSYTYPYERTDQGLFIRHTIQGEKRNITPSDDLFQILTAHERWVALLHMNDGKYRIVGTLRTPLRFLGGGTYEAGFAETPFTSWRFISISLAPSCFIDSGNYVVVQCSTLSADDFIAGDWFFDLDATYLGVEVPIPTGIVASIVSFDDGTIGKVGGGFADTITETGGQYFFDDGPWELTPGTYTVNIPMSVVLIDGSACGFSLQYTITILPPPEGHFDQSFFDPTYFY